MRGTLVQRGNFPEISLRISGVFLAPDILKIAG
jgi:hypothetical protein